jgi:RNA polymerase sigma-70 factor (ECF subfamily)
VERELRALGDEELLARCRDATDGGVIRLSISILAERHHARLVRYLQGWLPSREVAEDVAQEAFIRLYRHARRYRRDAAKVRTWLYRIASNLARNALRDRARKPAISLERPLGNADGANGTLGGQLADDSAELPMRAAQRGEVVRRVRAAVGEVQEPYRSVLLLCDLEGMTYKEAAEVLEVPVGTIRSRLFRARSRLQAILGPMVERGDV